MTYAIFHLLPHEGGNFLFLYNFFHFFLKGTKRNVVGDEVIVPYFSVLTHD